MFFRRGESSAAREEADGRGGERDEIGDDDREGGALCAVEYVGNAAEEKDTRDDHDAFFHEFEDGGKKKLFVSPKAAANDGVDGGKNKSDEQNGEDIQASVVGKEKGKFFSEEEKDEADGKGEEQ